jgi:hypothetical protein
MGADHQPRRFLVSRSISKATHQPCWAVKQGARWRCCEDLTIQVTVASVDVAGEGACLSGVGVVRTLQRGAIVITA